MQPNLIARHALLVFFAVSLGFSALMAYLAHSSGNENLSILIPLSPSLLAVGVSKTGMKTCETRSSRMNS